MLHCVRRVLLALLECSTELGIRRVVMEHRNHHYHLDSRNDLPFSLREDFLRNEKQTRVTAEEGSRASLRALILLETNTHSSDDVPMNTHVLYHDLLF